MSVLEKSWQKRSRKYGRGRLFPAAPSRGGPGWRLYAVLTGEREGRAASADPHLPRNYLLNLSNGACSKLAEQLASPGLTLPWMMAALGIPASLVAFLAPIKQVGSLLPQMAVSARIGRLQRRKWAWVAAGIAQALALLAIIAAIVVLPA